MVPEVPTGVNEPRCHRLVQKAISKCGLDLSGFTLLTEAATGYYALTPLIAAKAGAESVLALTRDSRYGCADTIREETMAMAERWGIADRLEILLSREDERIGTADIATNLGFVRPLDGPFLQRLKPTTVVPLMFETWEYRPEDVDLRECRRLGIPVLGTNETHPALKIFQYVGYLALKLLLEMDVEILGTTVAVLGGGHFGAAVVDVLEKSGADVTLLPTDRPGEVDVSAWAEPLSTCDALVVAEHTNRETLIGPSGRLTARKLKALNPGIVLAHVAGGVEQDDIEAAGIPFAPPRIAPPGHMSLATDYVGPRPLIDLHTAGLKVGEAMARARLSGKPGPEAERAALQTTPFAQGFAKEQESER